MAEIDKTNPLPPVWPNRPVREIDPSEKTKEDRRRRKEPKGEEEKSNGPNDSDDDSPPHIDEYV